MHLEKLKAKNDRANITYKSEVQKINKEQEHSNNKTNSNAATENSRKNKENTHSNFTKRHTYHIFSLYSNL